MKDEEEKAEEGMGRTFEGRLLEADDDGRHVVAAQPLPANDKRTYP